MTTAEKFNLSEKMDIFSNTLKGKDAKEFIRLLKENISKNLLVANQIYHDKALEEIDKLAGDKLK